MKTILLNSSGFRLMGCSQRAINRMILGYHPRGTFNDTLFGTAFHRYKSMVSMGEKASISRAAGVKLFNDTPCIIRDKKEWVNAEYLNRTIAQDWMEMEEGTAPVNKFVRFKDNSLAIEHTFAIPYLRTPEFEVILCGTIDKIVTLPAGIIAIGDYKTTASWNKEEFFQKYRLSGQLMFYAFCIKYLVENVVEAEKYKDLPVERIGTFVDAIFIKKDALAVFQRSPILTIGPEQFDSFERTLDGMIYGFLNMLSISDIVGVPREGIMTGLCEGSYGKPCEYFNVCACPVPELAQSLLDKHFDQKTYNPIGSQREKAETPE